MAGKYFGIPFAATGDRTAVPDAVQPDGSVSYSQGFGFDYERANTDPAYKPVPRNQTNQIYFDLTEALGIVQKQGFADWTSAAAPYAINSVVRHSGQNWQSAIANNSDTPGVGAGATSWFALGQQTQLIDSTRIDVASAATVDLTALAPNTRNIRITGTTTITGFTLAVGRLYFVSFSGALTLTNNAAIVTNTGGNITTFAGMTMAIRATAANTVEVLYVPRYASNAEVQAGARADVAVTPASLASLVKDYTSPPTTYANGGQLTFNHGLGVVPSVITWQLTCVIAQGGYSVGDVLFMPVGISGSGGSTGIITRATSTQIIANIGSAGLLTLTLPSGSGGTTLTPANWTITARAKL